MKRTYHLQDYEAEDISFRVKVEKYRDIKKEKKLYMIGEDGYIVVDYGAADYKNESYEQHEEIEDFTQTDQTIFYDESTFTTFGQY